MIELYMAKAYGTEKMLHSDVFRDSQVNYISLNNTDLKGKSLFESGEPSPGRA